MKTKILTVSIALVVIISLLLAACAAPSPTPTPAPTPTATPTPTPTPSPPPAEEVWKLKLQSNWTGIGVKSYDIATPWFCDMVSTMSNGRIEVTNYDAEVLVGYAETHKGVGSGVVDLVVTAAVYNKGMVPLAEYLTEWCNYTFDSYDISELAWEHLGLKELWREAYAPHGIMHLTYDLSDSWGTMISKVPVRSYSDYDGLKVRAFGLFAKWVVENGASLTVVAGGELYSALQTGVLDVAMFGGPGNWAGIKAWEVCDYFIYPAAQPYNFGEVIMNLETFNEMPSDLQEVMIQAARLFSLQKSGTVITDDVDGLAEMKANGMEFIKLPEEDLRAADEFLWVEFQKLAEIDELHARLVEIIKETKRQKEIYFTNCHSLPF